MSKLARILILLCAVVFLSVQLVSRGYAQSPLTVTSSSVSSIFPDSITFHVSASSTTEIEKVTLIYGTNGRSCQANGSRQAIDFTPEATVTLDWEWELRHSGSLPPGSTVWWQWEVKDADGNTETTEREEVIIEDERFSWKTIDDNDITVHWVHGDNTFGRTIVNNANTSLDRISADMGVPRPDNISLWVYPTAEDVRDALVYSSEWAGGVAFPNYGITILGIAPGEDVWQKRVIPHELTHLVVGVRTFNCRGIHLPTWLSEGLARYAEGEVEQTELGRVDEALANGRLPTLRSLANGFSAYGGSAGLSYTQSYIIVQYLIETFGAEKMDDLLGTMQSGLSIDDALEQVYGFDTDGLDVVWRSTTGYAATPTSVADALAAQATPTIAPTLALFNPLSSQSTATPLPPTVTVPPTPTAAPSKTAAPTKTAVPTVKPTIPPVMTPPATNTTTTTNNNWLWIATGALIPVFAGTFIFIRKKRRK